MNKEILRHKQQLDDLFRKIDRIPVEDIELRSHWARYLCVRVSGFLETSLRSIYSEYARRKAAPFIADYVTKQLSGLQNPNMDKILKLASSFNPKWSEEIQSLVEGEIKDAIDSIVAVRNEVSHGKNTGITFTRIQGYYKHAVELIKYIDAQIS